MTTRSRPWSQAAIAHAQFETIHPFADGSGRTGRALIHIVLRRRGLAQRVLPPVPLVPATWARSYIDGLTQFRHLGAPAFTALERQLASPDGNTRTSRPARQVLPRPNMTARPGGEGRWARPGGTFVRHACGPPGWPLTG